MEESRRVFHHFVVQSVLKCCKSGGHRSCEVILAIGFEEDTWQQIEESGK
jgi:hypothetical protein